MCNFFAFICGIYLKAITSIPKHPTLLTNSSIFRVQQRPEKNISNQQLSLFPQNHEREKIEEPPSTLHDFSLQSISVRKLPSSKKQKCSTRLASYIFNNSSRHLLINNNESSCCVMQHCYFTIETTLLEYKQKFLLIGPPKLRLRTLFKRLLWQNLPLLLAALQCAFILRPMRKTLMVVSQ